MINEKYIIETTDLIIGEGTLIELKNKKDFSEIANSDEIIWKRAERYYIIRNNTTYTIINEEGKW